MLRYLKTLALFLLIGFTTLAVVGELLIPDSWIEQRFTGININQGGQRVIEQKKIIIGDSVAGQLFESNRAIHKEYFVYTMPQASSLIGQYILLANLLKFNPSTIDEVILAVVPQTLSNNADQVYSYRHILGDLFHPANFEHFSPTALRLLSRWKPFFLMSLSLFKANPGFLAFDYGVFAPAGYNITRLTYNSAYLSDLSLDYLKRMQALTKKHGARFSVAFCPISKEGNTDLSHLRRQVAENQIEELFGDAFGHFTAFPADYFSEDDLLHLKREYVEYAQSVIYPKLGIKPTSEAHATR